jgi:hypothetical protein
MVGFWPMAKATAASVGGRLQGVNLPALIRRKFSGDETNLYINWMKHGSGPDTATISEREVVVTIIRAIQKFVAAYEAICKEFNDFSDWCINNGYTKTPLVEKPIS